MWNAIRSDLKEFASSIATDGTQVLENIDAKLKEESSSSSTSPKHYIDEEGLLATIDPEITPTTMTTKTSDGESDNGNSNSGANANDVYNSMLADAQVEAFRRMEMEVTYLTPLLRSEVNGVKKNGKNDDKDSCNHDHHNDNNDDDDGLHHSNKQEAPVVAESEQTQTQQQQDYNYDKNKDSTPKSEEGQHEHGTSDNNGDNDHLKDEKYVLTIEDNHGDEKVDDIDNIDNVGDDDDDDDDDDVVAIQEYLSSFNIQSKTEEISELLSAQPFLAQHFENLVPVSVTYEQFWQRYFFRCDPLRIIQEWEEEEQRLRQQRKELIGKGVKSVQNIFGGAFKAIKGVTTTVVQEGKHNRTGTNIYEKYQAELEVKQKAMLLTQTNSDEEEKKISRSSGLFGGALGMFSGNNGRPPFVLNTVESEEEEEYENQDEEYDEAAEEEELSWGSDEEEDDDEYEEESGECEDDDSQNDNLNRSEIIVFDEDKDTSADRVIQEIGNLKIMLEDAQGKKHKAEAKAQMLQNELDQLHEQMQKEQNEYAKLLEEEIAKVRNEERVQASALLEASSSSEGDDDTIKQISQQLDEMQLLKQDAESKVCELEFELNQCKEEARIHNVNMSRLLSEEKMTLDGKHAEEMKMAQDTIDDLRAQLETSKAMQQKQEEMTKELEKQLNECKQELKTQTQNFKKMLGGELAKVASVQKVTENAQGGSSLSSAVEGAPHNDDTQEADDEDDGWGGSWESDDD